ALGRVEQRVDGDVSAAVGAVDLAAHGAAAEAVATRRGHGAAVHAALVGDLAVGGLVELVVDAVRSLAQRRLNAAHVQGAAVIAVTAVTVEEAVLLLQILVVAGNAGGEAALV